MAARGVLVVGATGTQGGAVVECLHGTASELDVVALTREPDGEAARELAERGVTVVQGDLWKPGTLVDAMAEVEAVFAMTDFWEGGFDGEVTQGVNLVNAARQAHVDHVVFSSVAGAGLNTDVPMVESKRRVEEHLRTMDAPATVLRPSYFMQNFELRREDIRDGTLALPLAPGSRLPLTDAMDLGRLTAEVLRRPSAYRGETVPVAGEELTLSEMARTVGDALDRDVDQVHIPIDVARSKGGDAYARLFEFYNESPPTGLVGELENRSDFEPTSLGEYLDRAGWTRPELPEGFHARVQ